MKTKGLLFLVLVSLLMVVPACTTSSRKTSLRNQSSILGNSGEWALKARYGKPGVALDLQYLRLFTGEMDGLISEMSALHIGLSRKPMEYFTSDQHDRVEQMMYRFIVCWESLWDLVEFYSGFGERVGDRALGDKGFLIGYDAALHLNYYGCKLVLTFLDAPGVVAKLNEGYPRCDIPSGTFDRMAKMVTSLEYIESVETSWKLFQEQADKPTSRLAMRARFDSECSELVSDIRRIRLYQEAQVDRLLRERAILFPGLENTIRHSKVLAAADEIRQKGTDILVGVAGLLGSGAVHLMKAPLATPIDVSREQVDEVRRALQPGDILFVFSKGYMTNLFIPGSFKHALTYVGTRGQRMAQGLSTYAGGYNESKLRKTMAAFARFDVIPGSEPDLVEAVGQGVIFNSLDNVLTGGIGRMVVLRPILEPEDVARQLSTVFDFLGAGYDFRFDFSEAERLCCTELVYRALHGVGPIRFTLTSRMGRMTLSADDIIRQHCRGPSESQGFGVVLMVEKDPELAGNKARILHQSSASARLDALVD